MKSRAWFRLDNVAKVFPVIVEKRRSSYFRVAVELTEIVSAPILQLALEKTIKRFPTFAVRLRRGLFWYFLEHLDAVPQVKPESNFFGQYADIFSSDKFLFHVMYHQRRIAMEVFHSVSDGKGAMEFLKALTLQYLREKGYPVHHEGAIIDPLDQIDRGELEDSFSTYFKKGGSVQFAPNADAHHIKGTFFDYGGHHLVHARYSTSAMLDYCRTKGTTLSAFLASVAIEAIAKEQHKTVGKRKPIIVMIPVDLRRYFKSNTLRNFISYVHVGGVIRPGTSFDDILTMVGNQLKESTKLEKLIPQINATLIVEQNPFIRFVPLFLKNIATKLGFRILGEPSYTFALSNLGPIQIPSSMKRYIDHFEFTLSSTHLIPVSLSLCSLDDALVLTIARTIQDRTLLKDLIALITDHSHLTPVVTGNRWEENG